MQRTPKQGRKQKFSGKNGVNIRKNSEVTSTPKVPENVDSPPWLSDSPCHSSAPSPIPFICTQDGSNGENDVVWNYYSPSSDKGSPTHDTPIRKRKKKLIYNDFSPVTRMPMKKKLIRPSLRKKEFLKGLKDELIALNKNVQGLMCSAPTDNAATSPDANTSFSAPVGHIAMTLTNNDCLFDGVIKPPQEPVRDKYNVSTSSLPLKNNVLDKVSKCNNEGALESDDSMNEFLLKASQMVEEEQLHKKNTKNCDNNALRNNRLSLTFKNNPVTKLGSPKMNNDSFENLIGNMNDSEIDFLTQAEKPPADDIIAKKSACKSPKVLSLSRNSPRLASAKKNTFNFVKNSIGKVTNISKNNCQNEETGDSILYNISNMSNLMINGLLNESRSKFGRHKSMPESPTAPQSKKLKSGGSSTFSRHSTMPTVADIQDVEGLSQPMKCTPDEIKKKHQAAREKLMARKQEPGSWKSSSLNALSSNPEVDNHSSPPNLAVQPNIFMDYKNVYSVAENVKKNATNLENNSCHLNNNNKVSTLSKNIKSILFVNDSKIQEEIERKRKEALQKLQMKKTLGFSRK